MGTPGWKPNWAEGRVIREQTHHLGLVSEVGDGPAGLSL